VRAALVRIFKTAGTVVDNEAIMGANYLIANHYQPPSDIDADPQQIAQELWQDVGADSIMDVIAPTTAARSSRSTSPLRAAKPVVSSHPPGFPSGDYLRELHEALAAQLKVLPTRSTHEVVADHTASNIIKRRLLPDPFKYSSNAAVTAVVLMDHCKESIREVLEAFKNAFASGDQTYNSKFEKRVAAHLTVIIERDERKEQFAAYYAQAMMIRWYKMDPSVFPTDVEIAAEYIISSERNSCAQQLDQPSTDAERQHRANEYWRGLRGAALSDLLFREERVREALEGVLQQHFPAEYQQEVVCWMMEYYYHPNPDAFDPVSISAAQQIALMHDRNVSTGRFYGIQLPIPEIGTFFIRRPVIPPTPTIVEDATMTSGQSPH
jgi:hypothetical protein